MLGVVIWSCQETGRAIVWCADHRDLAHYGGANLNIQVGDLVQVTLKSDSAVRRCQSMKLVEQGYFPDIAEELKGRTRAIAAA